MKYDPQQIETKIQTRWEQEQVAHCNLESQKPKYYILDMFPYPSGHGLHVGHLKGYIGTDIVARYKKLNGFEVLHPMGWDSFGLPTERQAERDGISPQEVTVNNIAVFKGQLSKIGIGYDWSREITTSSPEYFKWTQWIFLKLYENGLAYQSEVEVNWCPALGTVLANEEVQDSKYIETGDQVVKKKMTQWMLKITAYADRLIDDLELVDWPNSVKEMQRNWIGRTYGTNIKFEIYDSIAAPIEIFTTNPETIFGVTFIAMSPDCANIERFVEADKLADVYKYINDIKDRSERDKLSDKFEKTAVFTGKYLLHPVTNHKIPLWISDFVITGFGTGVVMGCPGHDKRDYDFAMKFNIDTVLIHNDENIMINSDFLNNLTIDAARDKINAWLIDKKFGEKKVSYKLRDWIFSRQRYWGEPIPIMYDENNKITACYDLPILLPKREDQDLNPAVSDSLQTPLDKFSNWKYFTDKNGKKWRRETNVMPQWAGSSWYYLRYLEPHNTNVAWKPNDDQKWLPIDMYVGGIEHATLHLLYARFWHKFFYDLKLTSHKEPFKKLCNQGMIHARSFKDASGKYYYPEEVEQVSPDAWVTKATQEPVFSKIEKMSKSKYNVVNPNDIIAQYGADSLRLYEMFVGPFDEGVLWDTHGINGCRRFLDRSWDMCLQSIGNSKVNDALLRKLHKTIKNITLGMDTLHFNSVISFFMQFINEVRKEQAISQTMAENFVVLLAPFAPHMAEELWGKFGKTTSVFEEQWPVYIKEYCVDNIVVVTIQVNGKLRATFEIEYDLPDSQVEELALQVGAIQKYIAGQAIKKVIVIKNKLINIVV